MISENRVDNGSFPIPKLLIDKGDVAHFMEEFKGFHAQFADCFSREEPRENFYQYMAGQVGMGDRVDDNRPVRQRRNKPCLS